MHYTWNVEGHEIPAMVNALYKDPESWQGWKCLKVQYLANVNQRNTALIDTNIKRLLEAYFHGKHGSTFISKNGSITAFCKDVSGSLLETLGRQIVEMVQNEFGLAGIFHTYDFEGDYEQLLIMLQGSCASPNSLNILPLTGVKAPRTSANQSDGERLSLGCKVLLVEDDPVTRWLVKMVLRGVCRLVVVPDAGKAISAYHHIRPDMVLLDINLPDKNGYEVMTSIMKGDPAAHIVMFSAQDSFENMVEMLASGAKGFIAKPFDRERLLNCVKGISATR